MKKKLVLAMSLSVLLFLLVACSNNTDSGNNEGEIHLVAAGGGSPNHGWGEGFFTPWMEEVTERTDGRVQFEVFYSGELVENTHEYDGLTQGLADIVNVPAIYDPQRFPMSEVTMLPLTHSDVHIASRAFAKLIESDVELKDGKSFVELEYGDNGLKALPVSTTTEYVISTTGYEFDSVDAVKSATLRTSSRGHEAYAQDIAAGSVTMPGVDMYDAMNRGAFEGAFYSIADWSGYGFQDLFKYTITGANYGHFNSTLGMTQETWDSLPEDVQEIMTEVTHEIIEYSANDWESRKQEMIDYSLENGGVFVDIGELDEEVQSHLLVGMEQVWYDFIELMEERDLPGKELAILWRDLVIEEGGDVPEDIKELE
ncbi:TRAP transporter substrate-binding protein DctP [Oceanobacillus longus]|uniref:TRAP transporter substrate-binding protein DctP n=1 Tax=Oceanobacillus longus TaxID=930120 RepID=A0ABV8GZR7_9BACI